MFVVSLFCTKLGKKIHHYRSGVFHSAGSSYSSRIDPQCPAVAFNVAFEVSSAITGESEGSEKIYARSWSIHWDRKIERGIEE